VQVGREEKLSRITADVMADNHAMQHISRKVGFKLEHQSDGHDFIAEYVL
jgi:acetyltransferase